MRTFAVETIRTLPRLTRLGQINDHTRISLGRIISEQSKGSPDGEFLLFDGRVHTYEAVDRRINNVVRGLIDVGVRQGDHVGVLMETRPSALVAIAALSRLGAVAVLMPPDGDLVEAARLGGVAEILTDPTNLDAARQLSLQVLVLGGGESRDLHLSDNARRHRHGADQPGRGRAARLVPAEPRVRPRPCLHRVQHGRRRTGRQADHQLPMGIVGVRHRIGRGAERERHRLLPDSAASPVRPAGGARRRRCRRSPRSPCPVACTRTASCRRSASTASPWSATPGRCCATSSTSPASTLHGNHPVRLFIGSGMPTGLWQRVTEAFAPARVVEFFATTDGQAVLANVSGAKIGSKGRPLPGGGQVELAAYDVDSRPDPRRRPRLRSGRGHRPGRPAAGPASRTGRSDGLGEAWRVRARRHLGFHRVPVPPRRRR